MQCSHLAAVEPQQNKQLFESHLRGLGEDYKAPRVGNLNIRAKFGKIMIAGLVESVNDLRSGFIGMYRSAV